MSNNTTAVIEKPPDDGEHNPATLLPLSLCWLFLAVLIAYVIIGWGWLSWAKIQQWRERWQTRKAKKQGQQNGGDATTDIPLEKLDSSGRTQDTEAGGEVLDTLPNNWEDTTVVGGDADVQGQSPAERRPSLDLGDLVSDSDSPTPASKEHDRTNVRRSFINPRTHATPEVDLARVRPDLHKAQSASSISRSRTISDTRSYAESSSMSATRTRSEARTYPAESSSSGRTRARSGPRIGLGISEVPPPLPRNRAQSTHRPSFAEHEPYPQPAFSTSGKFARTMGTKNLDTDNWLTLDHQYPKYHDIRAQILATHPNETMQMLKGSEDACKELFHKVTSYLLERYPEQFQLKRSTDGKWAIHNLTTMEKEYYYTDPLDTRFTPLEMCAKLTQDDFNILMQDPEDGEHKLVASATLFPAAWKLRERIGYTITQLHAPVPHWSTKLSSSVEKYFTRLQATTSPTALTTYGLKERAAYFIQTLTPTIDLLSHRSLFIQTPNAMFSVPTSPGRLDKEWIVVRKERQTFTRLEHTRAIVFKVRTSMERLTSLSLEDLDGLRCEVRAWPEDVATYRCCDVWGDVLLGYCDEMCAHMDEEND